MRKRLNLRMSGLGGQGVVTSAHVLATAASKDGRHAISNPFFGAEKRMAPAESYVRIADERIYDRGELVYPDVIMVFHPQVITMGKCYTMPFYSGIKPGGLLIINSDSPLPLLKADLDFLESQNVPIFYIAATTLAVEIAGTELASNMGMLGALMGATKLITMDSMELAIQDRFGKKYVASGGTATLDEAIKKKFAKKEQLLKKNMETIRRVYDIGAEWAETIKSPMLV
ncbi:MAG: 2-oxoacid:acceptor oxidoreductase family protein [Nitrospira sp.]|nr:ferredoxin oxidoreductase [Candidatus Manganitrophaceae bacterium]HIL35745.1 ferredoxin oxidoreductase [Candidatus Manganitrophaceae bacterium]